MLKISIPTPCHEDWNAMTPNKQGRHCSSCAKTVVDFTTMSDDAIKQFFISKKEEKVCGRFRHQQLQRITIELPQNIFNIAMPVWKKFLVASLIVFSGTLFSCDTLIQPDTFGKIEVSKELTVTEFNMGKPLAFLPQLSPPPTIAGTIMVYDSAYVSGDVMVAPPIYCSTEEIVKGGIDFPDIVLVKPTENKFSDEIGQVLIKTEDFVKTKNPPKTDSINCDTQIYY